MKRVDEIVQIFDEISYNKGESILVMLVDYIGIDSFLQGVRLYLRRHAYGNIVANDLWGSLMAVSGNDIGCFMREWTESVGYPVLIISEEQEASGTSVKVSEHRFLKAGPAERTVPWVVSIDILTERLRVPRSLNLRSNLPCTSGPR